MAKNKPRTLGRTEQIGNSRKGTALDIFKKKSRASGGVNAPLDLGHLQIRIDRLANPHQLTGPFQVVNTISQAAVDQ